MGGDDEGGTVFAQTSQLSFRGEGIEVGVVDVLSVHRAKGGKTGVRRRHETAKNSGE